MFTFEDFAKFREGQWVENSCVSGQSPGIRKNKIFLRTFWISEAFLFPLLSPEKKGDWQTRD